MLLRNVSPRGALDVPLVGRVVEHRETFEVTAEQGKRLLAQPENFEQVDEPKPAGGRSDKKGSDQ